VGVTQNSTLKTQHYLATTASSSVFSPNEPGRCSLLRWGGLVGGADAARRGGRGRADRRLPQDLARGRARLPRQVPVGGGPRVRAPRCADSSPSRSRSCRCSASTGNRGRLRRRRARAGRTPSPDVMCNRMIKFGAFVERPGPSFDLVASGHHARVDHSGERVAPAARGVDRRKDQTYFLSQLEQRQLARCLFPIGDSTKQEVRAEARRLELPNASRPDSQGICFLGRVPFDDFVRAPPRRRARARSATSTPAPCSASTAASGSSPSASATASISRADPGTWSARTGEGRPARRPPRAARASHPTGVRIPRPHWIADPLDTCRPRGQDPPRPERLEPCLTVSEGAHGSLVVTLRDATDPGIAPGQFAALYDGEECLGGGVIAWLSASATSVPVPGPGPAPGSGTGRCRRLLTSDC
jgi:hypothetical protein